MHGSDALRRTSTSTSPSTYIHNKILIQVRNQPHSFSSHAHSHHTTQFSLNILTPTPLSRAAIRSQARKHITTLHRARPGITIEIRWCPAYKGIAGNEKAGEWAKIAAAEPDTHEVEWLNYKYDDRSEVRAIPLPRSHANLKREISEKKWVEGRQWAGGRASKTKYRMPKSQRPDGAVAGSTKRLASRFYQIRTGHCLTGQYLN